MSGKPAHCGCVQAVSFSWTSAVPSLTQEMQCMIHDTSDIRRGLDSIENLEMSVWETQVWCKGAHVSQLG